MNCFSCIASNFHEDEGTPPEELPFELEKAPCTPDGNKTMAQRFTLRELAAATRQFKLSHLVGEGGFGKVYRGKLESGQVVAVKQLNRDGMQGPQEFLVECSMLIMLNHVNLVKLIGYCAEGEERLLVYEYMPQGCLEDHLFDLPSNKKPLDWNTRIRIAVGAAKGLTYLHDVVNPPVIYRDLKSANILLDNEFKPKLSDFGLAKLGPVGDKTHVSTRVMGTYGYCAPDYAMSGKLTVKSDVYSFGVVLLELITGRRAFDYTKPLGEQNLFVWSRPFLKDKKRFAQMADPLLKGRFPLRPLYQLTAIISMCLNEQPHLRPSMHDVSVALEHVASQPYASESERKVHASRRESPKTKDSGASAVEEDGKGAAAMSP